MWMFIKILSIFVIINSLSASAAVAKTAREIAVECESKGYENDYIEYIDCFLTDILSSKEHVKVTSSNMNINDLIETSNMTIYVDIVGNDNYPEKFPEKLGSLINGTGGFTYKNTPLKHITRADFKDMAPNLYLIILEDNKIEEIPFDTFYDLPNLHYLDVRSNKLKSLAPNLLANAPIFTTLIIENNEIAELHQDLFKNCPNFYVLYAEFNKIGEIHEGLFKNNPKIEIVSMRHNQIRNIPINFLRFKDLGVADFTHNYGTCDTMFFSFPPYKEYYDENEQKKWIKNVPEFQQKVEATCRNL